MHLKRERLIDISLSVLILGAFVLAGTLIVQFVNEYSYKEALKEAREKADIIITRNLATHEYLNSQLKPSVFELTDGKRSEGYFDPHWMSSTYCVREIDRNFKAKRGFEDYYYKEAAINARTPENEADDIEREFLLGLNRGEAEMESGIREIDGVPYYVVMKKGETLNEGCLMCHDTHERAPSGLVDYYGPERSFGRHAGEVVSALSIRIPMADALTRAGEISSGLILGLLSILGVLLLSQVYITHRLQRGRDRLVGEVSERKATEERLREALRDKDMLMREVHHRVKNSLSVIQSLLNLQHYTLDDERSRAHLKEAQDRVKSMSMIYERLQRAEDVRAIDAPEYIRSLVNMLFESGKPANGTISMTVDIGDASIDIDTMIPLGLLINELFSNAFKHAFPEGRGGTISFSLKCDAGGSCKLDFIDDGVGIGEGMDMENSHSLGMSIITALVRQIGGNMEIKGEKGTRISITFPPSLS